MTYDRQATYSLFPVLRSCFELLCIALDSTFIIDPMALRIQWLKIYRRSQELVLVKFILHVTLSAVMTPISHSFYDFLCHQANTTDMTGKTSPFEFTVLWNYNTTIRLTIKQDTGRGSS